MIRRKWNSPMTERKFCLGDGIVTNSFSIRKKERKKESFLIKEKETNNLPRKKERKKESFLIKEKETNNLPRKKERKKESFLIKEKETNNLPRKKERKKVS